MKGSQQGSVGLSECLVESENHLRPPVEGPQRGTAGCATEELKRPLKAAIHTCSIAGQSRAMLMGDMGGDHEEDKEGTDDDDDADQRQLTHALTCRCTQFVLQLDTVCA